MSKAPPADPRRARQPAARSAGAISRRTRIFIGVLLIYFAVVSVLVT